MAHKKTIIAVWNKAGTGKTSTIRELANLVLRVNPKPTAIFPSPSTVPNSGDFRLIVKVNSLIVAFESKGDPNTDLENRLLDLTDNHNADVIFCTTRTSGATVKAVENIRINRGFETIWTSTYQIDHNQQLANSLKAEHILDLCQKLSVL